MTVDFINGWGLLLRGGPMIWPIFLLSLVAVTVAIEKFLNLSRAEQSIKKFKPMFFIAIRENRMKDALSLCEENPSGLGNICKAGLMKFGFSVDQMKASMETAAAYEIHTLKERLNLLCFTVNAAPLLGLLGTTAALCVVFRAAQLRANALNPLSLGDMSSGIWQALITTSVGLAVGIVCFAIYSFTASRINDVIMEYDQTLVETIEILQAVSQLDRSQESMAP